MDLDIVEVVMRCEEIFDVRLEPIRLDQMRTVGDLFELVCEQLNLPGGAPVRGRGVPVRAGQRSV
jgi:hypothetical protein